MRMALGYARRGFGLVEPNPAVGCVIVKQNQVEDNFSTEGNIEYLKSKRGFSPIEDASVSEIKEYLMQYGIECRIVLGDW